MPSETSLGHFSGLALDSVRLAPRARTRYPGGEPAALAAIGNGGVAIGNGASTGALISGRDINVDGGATVSGYAWATNRLFRQAGATITGDVIEGQPFATQLVPLVGPVTVPTNFQPTLHLEPNHSATISPGAFEGLSVKTGARLRLRQGTYFVGDLGLEPGGTLELANAAAPIEVHVFRNLNCKGNWRPDSPSSNVRIVYWSTNSTVIECNLPETPVVAPNAFVRSADRVKSGQIVARGVELGVEAVAEAAVFHSFTSGPGAVRLSDLTLAQRQTACNAVVAFEGAQGRLTRCRREAHGFVHASRPGDDAEAQALCTQRFDECMTEPTCTETAPFPAACTLTLGERDACLEAWIPRLTAAFSDIPACDDFTVFGVYTYRPLVAAPLPPECVRLFQCLSSG